MERDRHSQDLLRREGRLERVSVKYRRMTPEEVALGGGNVLCSSSCELIGTYAVRASKVCDGHDVQSIGRIREAGLVPGVEIPVDC